MKNEELYAELVDYIYTFERKQMTQDEAMAARSLLYNKEAINPRILELYKKKGWYSDDPKIHSMFADGHDAFKQRVVLRIWTEQKHELNLNLCPKCGKIARTPLAKQCRFCFYDWHSQ